jgi:thiamine biosynthesis lipoprotein
LETRLNLLGQSCHIVFDVEPSEQLEVSDKVTSEFKRIDDKFSAFNSRSVVAELNQNAGTGHYTSIDAESRSLFEYVAALWGESNHLFDPTTRVLQDCYDDNGRAMATPEQLSEMVKLVGWSNLEVSQEGARLDKKGMLIDLNSCIRPYAIDCVQRILRSSGVNHALITLDRDMSSLGKRPDGANWLVGVRHPGKARTAISRLKLNNQSLAIRGDFERHNLINGERFGRALSPIDGQPIPGLLRVVVAAESCLAACGAASVARFRTESAGIQWLEKLGYPWMAVDRNLACHGPLAP